MRSNGEFLSSTPPFVTASESSHSNENKLLNNEIKHMESITAAVSSSAQQQSTSISTTASNSPTNSKNANLNSHNSDGNDISIAKINDSVDDKNEIVSDSGNDDHENQQVKSETSSPSVNCDSENGLKSESESNNDTENVNRNRHNKSNNDDNDKDEGEEEEEEQQVDRRKCNLERRVKHEENSPENNSQSESYKENLHLQGEASSLLPRITNNFHHEEATGKGEN